MGNECVFHINIFKKHYIWSQIRRNVLTRCESLVVNVIGSDVLGSRQWKSIFPQAVAPAAPSLAASISSILIPSAANSTCEHSKQSYDSYCTWCNNRSRKRKIFVSTNIINSHKVKQKILQKHFQYKCYII